MQPPLPLRFVGVYTVDNHSGMARLLRRKAWGKQDWRRLETLERRLLLSTSPFGLSSFTPLGNSPTIIAGPGGLNGVPQFDLNGDGLGDMIVLYDNDTGAADSTTASVSAMLMHTDGSTTVYHIASYAIPTSAPLPVINQVVVGDVNGDGHPDVAILHNDGVTLTTHRSIDIFLGQADGSFAEPTPPVDLAAGISTPTMSLFDQNGDGKTDLFLEDGTKFTAYLGSGDGALGAPVVTDFQTLLFPLSLNKLSTVTNASFQQDLSGDGIPDLVVSGRVPSFVQSGNHYGLYVFKGQASGAYNLATASFSDTSDNLTLLSVRQLSSDNLPDIVAYNSTVGPDIAMSMFVFRNNGNGAFTQSFHSPSFSNGLPTIALGLNAPKFPLLTPDLTGDGVDDMILVEGGLGPNTNVTLHIEKNNGNAGFTETQQIAFTSSAYDNSGLVEDVDGDGLQDLVVYRNVYPSVLTTIYFNHGGAVFDDPGLSPVHSSSINPLIAGQTSNPGLGDFNGDGKLDLVYTGFSTAAQKNILEVLLNTTGRAFGPAVDTVLLPPVGGPDLARYQPTPPDPLLDYTGDGMSDLLGYDLGFWVLASTGDGHFTALEPPATFGDVGVSAPTAADINHDSQRDLVFVSVGLPGVRAGGLFVVVNGVAVPTDTAGRDRFTARDLGTLTHSTSLTEFVDTTVADIVLDMDDFYKFTLSSAQAVQISAAGAVGDVALVLQDSDGTGMWASPGALPGIDTVLAAGTYYIGVEHSGGADTNYRLDIVLPGVGSQTSILEGFAAVSSGQANAVDFGTVFRTAVDTTKTFTVRNDGLATLHLGLITLPTGYTFGTDALTTTIAPGAGDTFSIKLVSDTIGTFSGNVSIASDDSASPFLLPVTGQVIELPVPPVPKPLIVVSQGGTTVTSGQVSPVSLGAVAQGGTPPQITFTVANTGSDTLTLSAFHLPAGYSQVEGLSTSLLPGQSDTFTVKLSSTATLGDIAGNITFNDNSGGVPGTFSIPITTHVAIYPPDLSGEIQDVLIGKLSVTSGVQAIPGDKVTLKLRVFNNGSGSFHAGTTSVAVSGSTDQVLDGSDRLLQTFAVRLPTIAAGTFKDVTLTVTLPTSVPAGDIFLLADLDAAHTLTESDETNNTAAAGHVLPIVLEAGQVGARSNVKLTFQQTDGTLITVSVTKGTAEVTVDPSTQVMDLTVAGTGPTVTITSKAAHAGGSNQIAFRTITVSGSLGTLTATTAQLTGTLNAAAGLKQLTLGGADGATINIGSSNSAAATVTLSLGQVKDTSLTSQLNIKSLTATDWLNNDSTADMITAPSIGTVTIKGDKKAALAGDFQAGLSLSGGVATTLKTFTAAGAITGVDWEITGAVGAITAARLIDSTIHVSVNTGVPGLPSQLSDFNAADTLAAIKTFTLKGVSGSVAPDFVNSVVAAPTISSATLRRVTTLNSGTPLGLAAHTLGTVTSIDANGKTVKRIPGTDGDFVLRLV